MLGYLMGKLGARKTCDGLKEKGVVCTTVHAMRPYKGVNNNMKYKIPDIRFWVLI